MESYILVTSIYDPFDWTNRSIERFKYEPNKSIQHYIKAAYPDANLFDFAVAQNGKKVNQSETNLITPRAGDSLTVCAIPRGGGGGGGKNIFKTVAMIAVMAVAAVVTGGGAVTASGSWFAAGSTSAMVAGAAVAMGGSLLVNAIFPVPPPDLGDGNLGFGEQSSNNSWNMTNPVDEGTAVPILYGTRKIAPVLISKHLTVKDNQQIMNLLYGVHDGGIDMIEEEEINDNPITNFTDVESDYRFGGADQDPIDWFNDTIYERAVNAKLDNAFDDLIIESSQELTEEWSPIQSTSETSRIVFDFNFPNGIGKYNERIRNYYGGNGGYSSSSSSSSGGSMNDPNNDAGNDHSSSGFA